MELLYNHCLAKARKLLQDTIKLTHNQRKITMDCHTRFYKKIERTQEEAKKSCITGLDHYLNYINDIVKKDDLAKERFQQYAKVIKRQIRVVEKGLCQRAVWNHQYDKHLTKYVDKKGLYKVTDYYDVFRRNSCPDDKLFSLEEALNYIDDPNNKCDIFPNTIEKLKEFWEKYPDGMIRFG